MKNLITFGCSFTEGDWPKHLSSLNKYKLSNKGLGGVGNYYIANAVYDTVVNSDDTSVIVMWSGIDRVDKVVSKEEFHYFDRYEVRNGWLHSGGKILFDSNKSKDRYWHNYYKTYHTEEDSYLQTLHHMIAVQEFLSNRKIPYLFLTYKDIFTDRYRKYKRAKNLENQINWDRFHFPDGKFGGEYEWVKDNNLTWAEDGMHPSSESHRKFAHYLNKLDECRYLFK
jgi:hypothetical protein